MTIFSPNSVGQHADAEVHLLVAADLELDAAVLRQAALGDVERRHDLEARGDRVAAASAAAASPRTARRRCGSGRGSSSRTARCGCRSAFFLIATSRITLHELDDRRLAGLVLEVDDVDVVVGVGGVVDVVDRRARRPSRRGRGPSRSSARCAASIAGSDATTGSMLYCGEELELVDRVDVRRVGHRDDRATGRCGGPG